MELRRSVRSVGGNVERKVTCRRYYRPATRLARILPLRISANIRPALRAFVWVISRLFWLFRECQGFDGIEGAVAAEHVLLRVPFAVRPIDSAARARGVSGGQAMPHLAYPPFQGSHHGEVAIGEALRMSPNGAISPPIQSPN
jgi:hypothetical protein